MKVYAKTDKGMVREINEDTIYIPENNDDLKLYIVADGMGGYQGGEIASSRSTEIAKKYILNNFEITFNTDEDILKLVYGAVEYANMRLMEEKRKEDYLENMGSTICIALLVKDRLYIAHAGDSRIYRLRKDTLRRLTKDHSYVQILVDDGTIKEEDSVKHPKKNMITKAIGMSAVVTPDVSVQKFINNDVMLLCSDGLTNYVKDEELKEILKNEEIEDPAEFLVDLANERGGGDNISVIVVKNI